MKELLKTILCYVVSIIVGMVLLSVFMHLNFFSGTKIYYYRSLYDAVLIVAILLAVFIGLSVLFRKKQVKFIELSPQLIVSSVAVTGLVLALFITIAPMTIDRSYTIFSLSDMSENDEMVFTAEEIENRFSQIYIHEYQSTSKRIEEQVAIGNMEEKDGGYIISEKGKRLVSLFRFVEKFYPVEDERIIYPVYTEETKP